MDTEKKQLFEGVANHIATLWLCGLILWSKEFTYIGVSPFYINEMVLGTLLINSIRLLKPMDFILILGVLSFLIAGTFSHGSFFFAAKDLSWLYYPLFLTVFPPRLPSAHYVAIITCCYIKCAFTLATYLGLSKIIGLSGNPYGDGVIAVFLIAEHLRIRAGVLSVRAQIYHLMAIATTFKTALLCTVGFPLLAFYRRKIGKWFNASQIIFVTVLFVVLVKQNLVYDTMMLGVEAIESIASIFNLELEQGSSGTSEWRANVWSASLEFWFNSNLYLVGDLPGRNFLSSDILGIDLGMPTGEGLGINRSTHSILIQILMKTGIVGFFLYFYYFFWSTRNTSNHNKVFQALVLVMAATGTVLEVPYGGPLFFAFIAVYTRGETLYLNRKHLNFSRKSVTNSDDGGRQRAISLPS